MQSPNCQYTTYILGIYYLDSREFCIPYHLLQEAEESIENAGKYTITTNEGRKSHG